MKSINDLCFVIAGGTPQTRNADYWNGNIPWISIKDFPTNTRYISTTEKTITEAGLKRSVCNMLKPGDIIISARGTVGKLRLVKKPMAFNQSCFGLRSKDPNLLNQHILFYWLSSHINEIQTGTHGAVFDTITRSDFDRIGMVVPPMPVQQHIVGVTSSPQ